MICKNDLTNKDKTLPFSLTFKPLPLYFTDLKEITNRAYIQRVYLPIFALSQAKFM